MKARFDQTELLLKKKEKQEESKMTKARIKYEDLARRISDAAGDMDEEAEPAIQELVHRLEGEPDEYFYGLLLLLTETVEQYQP